MNVLSLFDGISCGQVALERAGIEVDTYFASEVDKHTIQITQKNYPNTIQLGNVTKVRGKYLPKIDLLIGGSPCQGFSFAGKQLNFDDPRSELFFEFVRLLEECDPRHFLLENVRMKKEYQDIISKYLRVDPIEINSVLVSAHRRKRLYWTNISGIIQPKDKGILLKDIIEGGLVDREKSYCLDASYIRNANPYGYFKKSRGQLVLLKDEFNYFRKLTSNELLSKEVRKSKIFRILSPLECERLQTVSDNYTEGISDAQRYKCLGNGWTVDVIAHIFKKLKGSLKNG